MKTRIYMVRHGFSRANNDQRFAGHFDVPLSEIGEQQARLAASFFKDHPIDAIYASDLMRAARTAAPIGELTGLPIQKDAGLREIFAGEWEGKLFAELNEEYFEEYKIWREDVGRARCTGGESIRELSERIIARVTELAEKHPGETLCLVTHATPIRAMCTFTAGLAPEEMAAIPWVGNASVSEFFYENGRFTRGEVDQTEHLGDLVTKLPKNV